VHLKRQEGVCILSLDRPKALNAINVPLAADFLAICRLVSDDATKRCILLRGEGAHFGVGGDLTAITDGGPDTVVQLFDSMHESTRILAYMDAPVVAAIHGTVAGGSMSLFLACDLAIAAEGTKFNLAYANVGASCDVSGSWNLPRMLGLRRALEIALLSNTFDADEALRLGIINKVVPREQLEVESMALALRLAAGPTKAYGYIKKLMRQSFETTFPLQLNAESKAFKQSSS